MWGNMQITIAFGFTLLIISLVSNIFLFFYIKNKKKTEKPKDSYELSQFLSDLMASGSSTIEVKRIAPTEFFLRSPRG